MTDSYRGMLVAGGVLALLSGAVQAEPRYRVTHVGNLPGGTTVYAQGIDQKGTVVGAVGIGLVSSKAFVWHHGQISEAPGSLGGGFVQAFAIGDDGTVVGEATDGQNRLLPVKWVNGVMIPLPTLGGQTGSARAVNSNGDIVGYAGVPLSSNYHAFKWTSAGAVDLGALAGPLANSAAHAISDSGDAVGTLTSPLGNAAPVIWDAGNSVALLASVFLESAQALAINSGGLAVGSVRQPLMDDQAVLFGGEAGYYTLAALPQDIASKSLAVNDRGIAVGWSKRSSTVIRAVIWDTSSGQRVARDLNTLIPPGSGWQLQVATGINNRGWIIGWGLFNGQRRGFVLRNQCTADIVTAGNPSIDAGPDGFITGEDFDAFVSAFFGATRDGYGNLLADIATPGLSEAYPDEQLTGDDFDMFMQSFFAGC